MTSLLPGYEEAQPRWFGHPKGVYLVAFVELWERFSYYGMVGILVLYLVAPTQAGGWGWEQTSALKLYGWYAGAAFAGPLAGAWLANNVLGERRCILWGGLVLISGHVLLAGPVVVPWIAQAMLGFDLLAITLCPGIVFGAWHPNAATVKALQAVAGNGGFETALSVYRLSSASFLAGLGLIIAGTALLKPAISAIIARFYETGDIRRDEAFALFFAAIYVGAFTANIVTGWLGERLGWHYGFLAAALGMATGLAAYLARQTPWLGAIGEVPAAMASSAAERLSRVQKNRIFVILVQGAFTTVYAAAFYQIGGLLNLYAHDRINRVLGGFEIPTTWFQTISILSFLVLTPILSRLWRKLDDRGRNPSASYKLSLGLAALGIAYLVVGFGERWTGSLPGGTPMVWLVLGYLLFGLGDALVWPNQISLVSKLAPARYATLLIGGWYVCIGIGTWLTGYIGALADRYSLIVIFLGISAGCCLAAVALALLTPALRRLMHGAE
jgi:proton-dependent oligopeptide transporter, POT family